MAQDATRPIVSGREYPVIRVAAGEPATLEEFLGDTWFVLDLDGDPYPVHGSGWQAGEQAGEGGGRARFFEKECGGQGRDVRIWAIRDAGGSRFLAEHVMR